MKLLAQAAVALMASAGLGVPINPQTHKPPKPKSKNYYRKRNVPKKLRKVTK